MAAPPRAPDARVADLTAAIVARLRAAPAVQREVRAHLERTRTAGVRVWCDHPGRQDVLNAFAPLLLRLDVRAGREVHALATERLRAMFEEVQAAARGAERG